MIRYIQRHPHSFSSCSVFRNHNYAFARLHRIKHNVLSSGYHIVSIPYHRGEENRKKSNNRSYILDLCTQHFSASLSNPFELLDIPINLAFYPFNLPFSIYVSLSLFYRPDLISCCCELILFSFISLSCSLSVQNKKNTIHTNGIQKPKLKFDCFVFLICIIHRSSACIPLFSAHKQK